MLLLCDISLLCIGFSTWYTTGGYTLTGDVSVNVGKTESFVIFSDLSINTDFKLSQDGMVKDEEIVKTGYISVSFSINNTNLKTFSYLKDDKFTMRAILTPDNSDFVSFITGIASSIDSTEIVVEDSNTSFSSLLSFPIDSTDESTSLTLTYTISGEHISSYYTKVPSLNFKAEGIK